MENRSGGRTMVIDAGEEENGQEVVRFLKERRVDRVDVLLITHFDKDHVGGADTLAEQMEIGRNIRQIAEIMQMPLSTVLSKYNRGLKKT